MEKPSSCDESVHKNRNDAARPTCSVPPSQQTLLESQCHNAENGAEERTRTVIKSDASLSMDTESEILGKRKKTTLIRSKTFDPSLLSHVQSDIETKIDRKKHHSYHFPRSNSQYHKVFKDISENEHLKQSYTCALQKDILYQGRLFVSENWICFHSKVFGKDTKISIPVPSVTVIKKTKTAILVPNALVIATAQERHVFVSFLSRDTTYKVLMSVCIHLHDKCLGSSPIPSSADRNYRVTPSALPMDFSGDLSDLDGPVIQTRQELGDSSSSESPDSPEFEKITEFPKRSQKVFLNVVKQDNAPDSHPQQTKHEQTVYDVKALRPNSLNILLMFYLFLVCILVLSSCYMAFKIISLEERLVSLGSLAEFSHNRDDYHSLYTEDTSEIYTILSVNLVKLEKIQRNLQKLLEDT
uniref:GRAM domain-containing protein 2B-like n=1 Tax=Astyanax mexicanus TaxID=7994 RepID=A0A3B1JJK6_ASTMX